jgi:plasmid stabilization system protein ParE
VIPGSASATPRDPCRGRPTGPRRLKQIWRYLAQEASVPLADRIREKLLASFATLGRHPRIGHKREDLTSLPVRFYSVYQYMIIYSYDSDTVRILSVIHGKRDLATLLAERFAQE